MASRLIKLRAMSSREIGSRIADRAYAVYERQLQRWQQPARADHLRRGLVDDLAGARDWQDLLVRRPRAGRFFAGVEDAPRTRTRYVSHYPEELHKTRAIADSVVRHRIAFFGRDFSFGERIDWHADPVSGAAWPRVYHGDVPISGGDRGYGDVKYVWELNRHQFLIDLAKAALIDDSDRPRVALQNMVMDWQNQVPYGTGAPWACALEPAFRVWSWLWAYHLLRASQPLDPSFHFRWLTGFHDHGRFLYRHLETYASPYNHLAGEASALFALGVLFPEFKEAAAWEARGRQTLESSLASQFHADGGSVEQSLFYHHATVGFYLLAALLARENGASLSGGIWKAVERGIEFSMVLMQPDGRVPSIGGADDGKPIRLEHLPFWDFRPYQAIGAVLFSRPDFKAVAGRFFEDAYWILGTEGAEAFDRLEARAPSTSRALSASGYFVARTSWSPDADYLCFDCGEQAAGLRRDGVPSAAHGHADCLSVIASLAGRPVLIDPGFYCYNGERDWEVHFRKTGAHNTISIDGQDQARHVSKMAWTHTYAPSFEGSSSDDPVGWAFGSHDGYADAGKGLIHRRAAWLRPGGYLVICDELTGGAGRVATANFQFAPGQLVQEADDCVVFDGRFELAWTCSVPVSTNVVSDGSRPSDGWIARSLGVRVKAPRFQIEFPLGHDRVVLLTVLADRNRSMGGAQRRVFFPPAAASAEGFPGATITGMDWDDLVVAGANNRLTQWRGVETDARVAAVRVTSRGVQDARRIGGSELRVREQDLPVPLPASATLATSGGA